MNDLMGGGEPPTAASNSWKQVEFKRVYFWKAVGHFVLFVSEGRLVWIDREELLKAKDLTLAMPWAIFGAQVPG